MMSSTQTAPVALPRVAITYCTQCRWMLRAAYFGQELLSTFGMQIGEIALIPATGGLFTVELVRHRNVRGSRDMADCVEVVYSSE
jgi:selT/selW/selH-like putative selenoprotein